MPSPEGQTVQRILLVDDHDAVLEPMRLLLESKGSEVVAVGDVTEALKSLLSKLSGDASSRG
jgi:CheY-like chemotaxis protein